MDNDLVKLTDLVITDVIKKDIVVPSHYKERFEHFAKTLGIDVDDEAYLEDERYKSYMELTELMENTRDSANRLQRSTELAKVAIEEKNSQKLDEVSRDVADLRREMMEMKSKMYSDTLTGKHNRMWLNEQMLDDRECFMGSGCLAFIDLDKFKIINDEHGHVVGDKVLIYVANFLSNKFPAADVIRYAGDEFLLLSDVQDPTAIDARLDNVLLEIEQKQIKSTNGELLEIGFSYGVICFDAGAGFREIVEQADSLMYEHKAKRKNLRS